MKRVLLFILVIFLIAGGYYFYQKNMVDPLARMFQEFSNRSYTYEGVLSDTQGLRNVRGVVLDGGFGVVQTHYEGGVFRALVVAERLPVAKEGDIYQVRAVRRGVDQSEIILGSMLVLESGVNSDQESFAHVLMYEGETDLRGHDLIVVSIEPDDGDPGLYHIVLEGELSEI